MCSHINVFMIPFSLYMSWYNIGISNFENKPDFPEKPVHKGTLWWVEAGERIGGVEFLLTRMLILQCIR